MKNLQMYRGIYFTALWLIGFVNGMEAPESHYGSLQTSIVKVDIAFLTAKGFDQLILYSNIVDEIPHALDSVGVVYAAREAFRQYKKHDMVGGCAIELREAELLEILLSNDHDAYNALLNKGLIKEPMQ